ncbi:uncharacterized protein LOC107873396 isoform X2 [Capsicum annuum]|uniref:uncharacterized protein LOC107873396 isoform X2 n=1 Tax=Capsicum annuum TaxID=4072 RepID=UPI001FB0A2AA|nr:uncharacterized protein LOC107873396 isoform X2 [Capsicum annuum]
MIEKRIGCGQVEELIEEAQDELKLIGHMNEWKPWGIPNDYECEVIENDAPVPKHIPLPVLVLSLRNSIRQWRLFLENWTLVQKRMNLQFLRVNQSRVFQKLPLEFGMIRSGADHSVFYRHSEPNLCIYLVVYVDDIVITGNDQDGITNLKQHLFQHFQTKNLGRLKYFLGIEVA